MQQILSESLKYVYRVYYFDFEKHLEIKQQQKLMC